MKSSLVEMHIAVRNEGANIEERKEKEKRKRIRGEREQTESEKNADALDFLPR